MRAYREVMIQEGFRFDPAPDAAFEPIWCAWGYGRDMTPRQLMGALPVLKKLGFMWVTLSWWDSWYPCPGDPAVVEGHKRFVEKAMRVWGFDGLKLDGRHMSGVPPCHNPAHGHDAPEDSVETLPLFFKAIYETARTVCIHSNTAGALATAQAIRRIIVT